MAITAASREIKVKVGIDGVDLAVPGLIGISGEKKEVIDLDRGL